MSAFPWLAMGAILPAAAALKAADRAGTTVALAAYGVPGRLAAPAWAGLTAVEAAAVGISRGLRGRRAARPPGGNGRA